MYRRKIMNSKKKQKEQILFIQFEAQQLFRELQITSDPRQMHNHPQQGFLLECKKQ